MARHGAPKPDQILIRVHADHVQVLDRDAPAAHASGQALSLDDTARIGARADRAGLLVRRASVGLAPRREMMATHDARESAALRRPHDVDLAPDLELSDREGRSG